MRMEYLKDRKIVIIQTEDIMPKVLQKIIGRESSPIKYNEAERKVIAETVVKEIEMARDEGYKRYALFTRSEAKKLGINIGISGLLMLVFTR